MSTQTQDQPCPSTPVSNSDSSPETQAPPQMTGPVPAWKKGVLAKGTQSPTDQNLSPTTQKLAAAKGRHFTKGKPVSLFGGMGGKGAKSGLGKEVKEDEEKEESK
ncbi:hypothetical protein BT69DRAFT_1346582 [Atractiella rhizophila]|nr:hypothetical protein BT69DRAFT_1346582 [Atractiella rhizophila]